VVACVALMALAQVSLHFRLHRETFYLSVYFIDRYLSMRSNQSRGNLQLIGISALFVAAKLEVRLPVGSGAYIVRRRFTRPTCGTFPTSAMARALRC
jgi:hypothetical protein